MHPEALSVTPLIFLATNLLRLPVVAQGMNRNCSTLSDRGVTASRVSSMLSILHFQVNQLL